MNRERRPSLHRQLRGDRRLTTIFGLIMLVVCIIYFLPILFAASNSFKPLKEIMMYPLELPRTLYLGNYVEVWQRSHYITWVLNSLLVTVITTVGTVVLSAMAGYRLSRMRSRRLGNAVSLFFYLSVMIPFQAIMICLVRIMAELHLTDSLIGLSLSNIGLGIPVAAFLYAGATRGVPKSLDESAEMDGAGMFNTFFRIVFPCLSSITGTVAIFTILGSWNDYLKPSILISSQKRLTLPVGVYKLVQGQYGNKAHLNITTLMMAAIPMIVVFLFMQRYIISGITRGAVKE